jgi:hypothetical protein
VGGVSATSHRLQASSALRPVREAMARWAAEHARATRAPKV